jgi:Fur family ferric uptake transcriptional regulator
MKADSDLATADRLRARIREAGLRCTAARLTVINVLNRSKSPLSHADIAATLSSLGFDRATVYRNLVEMAEAGLLSRVDLGDHVWRFELRREDNGHAAEHPHFLCTECGGISCLAGVQITIKAARGMKRSSFGAVTEVLLKGRCVLCG